MSSSSNRDHRQQHPPSLPLGTKIVGPVSLSSHPPHSHGHHHHHAHPPNTNVAHQRAGDAQYNPLANPANPLMTTSSEYMPTFVPRNVAALRALRPELAYMCPYPHPQSQAHGHGFKVDSSKPCAAVFPGDERAKRAYVLHVNEVHRDPSTAYDGRERKHKCEAWEGRCRAGFAGRREWEAHVKFEHGTNDPWKDVLACLEQPPQAHASALHATHGHQAAAASIQRTHTPAGTPLPHTQQPVQAQAHSHAPTPAQTHSSSHNPQGATQPTYFPTFTPNNVDKLAAILHGKTYLCPYPSNTRSNASALCSKAFTVGRTTRWEYLVHVNEAHRDPHTAYHVDKRPLKCAAPVWKGFCAAGFRTHDERDKHEKMEHGRKPGKGQEEWDMILKRLRELSAVKEAGGNPASVPPLPMGLRETSGVGHHNHYPQAGPSSRR